MASPPIRCGWREPKARCLLLGLAGAATALWRRDQVFLVFASWWGIGIVAAYSLIPYKTPWLTLNMIPPLAICGGYAVDQVARVAGRRGRRLLVAVGCVLLGLTAYQSVDLNFVALRRRSQSLRLRPDQSRAPGAGRGHRRRRAARATRCQRVGHVGRAVSALVVLARRAGRLPRQGRSVRRRDDRRARQPGTGARGDGRRHVSPGRSLPAEAWGAVDAICPRRSRRLDHRSAHASWQRSRRFDRRGLTTSDSRARSPHAEFRRRRRWSASRGRP